MKTKEELNALKEEVETVSRKLSVLTEEELKQVSGGSEIPEISPIVSENMFDDYCGNKSPAIYGCGYCPVCGLSMQCGYSTTLNMYIDIHCTKCGHTEPNRYQLYRPANDR